MPINPKNSNIITKKLSSNCNSPAITKKTTRMPVESNVTLLFI